MCPDASQTYIVAGDTTDITIIDNKESDSDLPIACGSISFPNDTPPSSGPFTFTILAIVIGMFNISRVKRLI